VAVPGDTSHGELFFSPDPPGHVQRRPSPLLRYIAALIPAAEKCGGHGLEGPHLSVVRRSPGARAQLLTGTAASS
jgi:hypothetical protein